MLEVCTRVDVVVVDNTMSSCVTRVVPSAAASLHVVPAHRAPEFVGRVSVAIFGSVVDAGITCYDDFARALQRALHAWQRPLTRIVVADRLDATTRAYVTAFAERANIAVNEVHGRWDDFGAGAEAARDQTIVAMASHTLAFAVGSSAGDERLFRRMWRVGVPFVRVDC